jgi:hypothetical protein
MPDKRASIIMKSAYETPENMYPIKTNKNQKLFVYDFI